MKIWTSWCIWFYGTLWVKQIANHFQRLLQVAYGKGVLFVFYDQISQSTFYLWESIIVINVVLGHFFSLWYIASYWWTCVFAFAYVKIYSNQLSFFRRGTSLIPIPCSQMSIESSFNPFRNIGKDNFILPSVPMSHPHPKT